jgi:hypothetical protein
MQGNYFFRVLVSIVVALTLTSCKEESDTGGPAARVTQATITGTVRDGKNNTPLAGASVNLSVLSKGIDVTKTSSSTGGFSFTVDLGDTFRTSGTLTITKSGYKDYITNVTLLPGQVSSLPDILVERDTTTSVGGGGTTFANTIAFISAIPTQLSVRGVGGEETSILTFEARDSLGVPIDFNHRDTIAFVLSGAPVAGGAYVSPPRAVTNASGRVAVTVNSGTISGSLQIVARLRREADGVTIQSEPARMLIFGGLPDQRYFSIAATRLNVPGLTLNGKTSDVSVIVGDKYGNPVAKGTAVHFFTDIGIVTTNTGFTDENGFATATLYSGNPRGVNGFGYVKARTVGEGGVTVIDSVRMLFSGPPSVITEIGIHLDTIPQEGCNVFRVRVSDVNGNPLTSGTTITPTLLTLSTVNISPPTIRMPDTQLQGPGGTEFLFTFCDVKEDTPIGGNVDVYITVVWEGLTVSQYVGSFYIR